MMKGYKFREKEREAFREAARVEREAYILAAGQELPKRADAIIPELPIEKRNTPLPDQRTFYGNDPWIASLKSPLEGNEKAMEILNKYFPVPDMTKVKLKGNKWGLRKKLLPVLRGEEGVLEESSSEGSEPTGEP